ncbi:MAG: cyclase family protein [candidate division NC10 bacterium]|nr:cyclase family protein [candidate division NC10 bacterium]
MRKSLIFALAAILVLAFSVASFAAFNTPVKKGEVVDLSLTVSMDLPGWWPFVVMPYVVADYNKHNEWRGPYWTRVHIIDSHTATHYDSPQHFIPPPGFDNDTYTPFAKEVLAEYEAKYGPRATTLISNDKVPVTQFVGPLRVVDVTHTMGKIPKSEWPAGPNIEVADIQKYEAKYGPIKAGDVVAFMSKWDKKYQKFPAGNAYAYDPLVGKAEGWPTPTPECVEYLYDKGVRTLVTDGASMGDVTGKKAIFTHWAGLGREMIYVECAANLDKVPADGSAFFAFLPLKTEGASGDIGRAIAIVGSQAKALNQAALEGKVVDLTTLLSPNWPAVWPGHFPLNIVVENIWGPGGPWKSEFKTLDEHPGTHHDAPTHFVPPPGFKVTDYYGKGMQERAAAYEKKWGKLPHSTVTNDKIPVEQFCGPLKVIDVGMMEGTAGPGKRPSIGVDVIKAFEAKYGALKPGDVVMIRTGYDDAYYKPFPEGNRLVADFMSGKAEGWPAPSADFCDYLAKKGVRNLAMDVPSAGGEDWYEAHVVGLGKGMIYVECLVNTADLPNTGAFFIYLPPKTIGSGQAGRAIAILP